MFLTETADIRKIIDRGGNHALFPVYRGKNRKALAGQNLHPVTDLYLRCCQGKLHVLRPVDGKFLPHIDDFLDNGYTKEEMKMVNETHKIMHDDNIRVTATTVRVPVYYGHSESINVETKKPFEIEDVKALFKDAPGCVLRDDPANNVYPLAREAEGTNDVYIGRIRRDFSIDNGINFWCVADNIRKGAAANAVQIAFALIEEGLI